MSTRDAHGLKSKLSEREFEDVIDTSTSNQAQPIIAPDILSKLAHHLRSSFEHFDQTPNFSNSGPAGILAGDLGASIGRLVQSSTPSSSGRSSKSFQKNFFIKFYFKL